MSQPIYSSDVNKDWTCNDKDKDKDLNLVLKESLRTRINITETRGVYPRGGWESNLPHFFKWGG